MYPINVVMNEKELLHLSLCHGIPKEIYDTEPRLCHNHTGNYPQNNNLKRMEMLNVKLATRPDRDKQVNVRDMYDVAKHTNVKSMLTIKSALTIVHMP